jgi:hypothetical protein
MVERAVGVKVGNGVFVGCTVPAASVVVGAEVLMTNKFGVNVGCSEKGVTVGCGGLTCVAVCKKGRETGNPLQPVSTDTSIAIEINLFITPLQ